MNIFSVVDKSDATGGGNMLNIMTLAVRGDGRCTVMDPRCQNHVLSVNNRDDTIHAEYELVSISY